MNGRSDTPGSRGTRFPLAAKLTVALLVVAAVMVGFLLLYFGPHTTHSFVERSDVLISRSRQAMGAMAGESTAASTGLLVDVIGHTADARRRTLADLPLTLYAGDVERIREAIEREDEERRERLQQNVGLLASEMERRAERRIDRHLDRITAEQTALGASFADDLRRSYLALSGTVLLSLIVLLGAGLYRVVVRPVRALRRATRAVTGGDLTVECDAGSGDEVGALSADFTTMVKQLRDSRLEIRSKNETLIRLNENLESEVARKTRHLEEALDDLRRAQKQLVHAAKMASLGTLAGGIAHEFNNLIGGIRGCAAEALEGEDEPRRREPLEVILRAARRGGEITEQLLQFSRRRVERMAVVDVAALLHEALALIEPQARRLGVAIQRRIAPELRAWADASGLHQVFLNLLSNALQAMPDGGSVAVEARRSGEELEVRVTDTGVGIPPDRLDEVFDPFFTSKDREADPFFRGTGLGLSVSFGIVEAHGGTLELERSDGRGSVFLVRFPVSQQDYPDEDRETRDAEG